MNNSHNIKVDMGWGTFTFYLKCDNPSVSTAEDHVRESIVVEVFERQIQVPPAVAKLPNTEIVVHKFNRRKRLEIE